MRLPVLIPLAVVAAAAALAGADARRIELWNGRDLAGWTLFVADSSVDAQAIWSVRDGILRFDTKASGYLKTTQAFSNYRLHVEWRWPRDAAANSNSGVMVHVSGPDFLWPASFEFQLKTGNAGQVVGMGLDIPDAPLLNNRKRAPRLVAPSEKPPGEWNEAVVVCRGREIEGWVNGVRQNHVTRLPADRGAIALQVEGFPIEFRHIWLEPL